MIKVTVKFDDGTNQTEECVGLTINEKEDYLDLYEEPKDIMNMTPQHSFSLEEIITITIEV
jgi:hypothetical protein